MFPIPKKNERRKEGRKEARFGLAAAFTKVAGYEDGMRDGEGREGTMDSL